MTPKLERISYDEARADLVAHYTTAGKRDVKEACERLKHVDAYFGHFRIANIGTDDGMRYAAARQGKGASNATINRELATLSKMLSLAVEHQKLHIKPRFHRLEEAKPRKRFFDRDKYEAVRKRLRPDLDVPVAIMQVYGWRKREVLGLEKRQLDFTAGTIVLDAGTTKNSDGRVVFMTPEVRALLTAQLARVRALEKDLGKVIRWLFPHPIGAETQSVGRRHVAVVGEPIRDFRRAWRRACREAGVPGMLRHDFRRTAVRNMSTRACQSAWP